jgi:succinate dehydrogenase / fumarate reductase, cytochrome b subunit
MWLINSSIGRKVVMSVTGIALILFLTFHGCMNVVALFSGKAYDMICGALGANWYAVVATLGLAALAVCHIVYAFILTGCTDSRISKLREDSTTKNFTRYLPKDARNSRR